jgi:hypothetical protein
MESENDNSLEVEVKVRAFNTRTSTFTEVITASAKITKADAGFTEGNKEEWISISIDPGGSPNYADAKVLVSTHSKACGTAQAPI